MANGRHEATEEAWERLRPTIERIVMKRRCTVAEAQMALIEACAQGRIRALWLGYYDPPCPLSRRWIGLVQISILITTASLRPTASAWPTSDSRGTIWQTGWHLAICQAFLWVRRQRNPRSGKIRRME